MNELNEKITYDYDFINSGLFKPIEIYQYLNIPLNTIRYYFKDPNKIRRARESYINEFYNYFKSLNLDETKLDKYEKINIIEYRLKEN